MIKLETLTPRQIELQSFSMDTLNKILPEVLGNLNKFQDYKEMHYYLKDLTTRLDIIMNMKYGLEDDEVETVYP